MRVPGDLCGVKGDGLVVGGWDGGVFQQAAALHLCIDDGVPVGLAISALVVDRCATSVCATLKSTRAMAMIMQVHRHRIAMCSERPNTTRRRHAAPQTATDPSARLSTAHRQTCHRQVAVVCPPLQCWKRSRGGPPQQQPAEGQPADARADDGARSVHGQHVPGKGLAV